ncbi:TipC family immunity protein [Rothia sp. CCM 9417]|uniref:TipC family immunity protein n=1 Tax=unclassified Rothia (in: high G+C Gram-positive bacteria) TaxID=2689056 RepID=UPI003ADE2852
MTWSKDIKLAVAMCSVLVLMVACALGYLGWKVATWGSIPAQESIFAEIYADTAKNYENRPSISHIQAAGQVDTLSMIDGDPGPLYDFHKNSDELDDIDDISMRFFFNSEEFVIIYHIKAPNGLVLREYALFNVQAGELRKNIRVKGADGKYLKGRDVIAQALADAGITKADVEGYYRAVVDDYILADWVEVFDSDFSPLSYGDVRVVDEWDVYFSIRT